MDIDSAVRTECVNLQNLGITDERTRSSITAIYTSVVCGLVDRIRSNEPMFPEIELPEF